jgi:P pilus assembly chaperone PapD
MMRNIARWLGVLMLLSCSVKAGVMVESSRVVFSADDRERSLMLSNSNDYPVVVQTWIDHGKPDGTPETAKDIPVMPLPGIFRLEPGEKKNLRLLATQIKQPQDRESLYWLNVYEIPPTDAHLPPGVAAVNVAVRLQLKMFFRPNNLKPDVDSLSQKQQFSIIRTPGVIAMKVLNPTPYYATFSSAQVKGTAGSYPVDIGMIPPFGNKMIEIDSSANGQPESISYTVINDDGNNVAGTKSLRQ